MKAKISTEKNKVNEITIPDQQERCWYIRESKEIKEFPWLKEMRVIKENKPKNKAIWIKTVQFRWKKDFDVMEFWKVYKLKYIEAYYHLVQEQWEQANEILSNLKMKTK